MVTTDSSADVSALLDVQHVGISFGGLRAVSDFSLTMRSGELHGLIGPNGAGKTTLFNILTGIYRPDEGQICLNGRPINNLRPHQIAAGGMARTFQNIRLFPNLTVLENVLVACHHKSRQGLLGMAFGTFRSRADERQIREPALQLLRRFSLEDRSDQFASNLSYGDQRRLEITRALATQPQVLLLDEPAAGMNAAEKGRLIELIRQVRDDFGVAVLLIEHDMSVVMNLCQQVMVLDHGCVIATGTPSEIQSNQSVIEAYLGVAPDEENNPASLKLPSDFATGAGQ